MLSPSLKPEAARRIWIRAQKLDSLSPFGSGPQATCRAIEHLGYVQIDTIHVIERCHHHILYNRIPKYRRSHLHQAQSIDRNVFEYWTHALSYLPTRDYRFFRGDMKRTQNNPSSWYDSVRPEDLRRLLARIRKEGPVSIRDIDDDGLRHKKTHPWDSSKPSKKVLQLAFYRGDLVVSERLGMLKKFDLTSRHFGWTKPPAMATASEVTAYLLERALRAQGVVSLDSICHLAAKHKPAVLALLEREVKGKSLMPVRVKGFEKIAHWAKPEDIETRFAEVPSTRVHLLSPFDPLVIQRRRLNMFFDYDHRFEAYIPSEKRVFGYFALPVMVGDRFVAAIDLKADRASNRLFIKKWTWMKKLRSVETKRLIEAELECFEAFQLSST